MQFTNILYVQFIGYVTQGLIYIQSAKTFGYRHPDHQCFDARPGLQNLFDKFLVKRLRLWIKLIQQLKFRIQHNQRHQQRKQTHRPDHRKDISYQQHYFWIPP